MKIGKNVQVISGTVYPIQVTVFVLYYPCNVGEELINMLRSQGLSGLWVRRVTPASGCTGGYSYSVIFMTVLLSPMKGFGSELTRLPANRCAFR